MKLPPAPGSPSGTIGRGPLGRLALRVAGAVDEAGHVERRAVDERRRLPGHLHVALRARCGPCTGRQPHQALVVVVEPEEQLLLGALGLAARAVAGLDGDERLEVVGHVVGQIGEQRGPEADDEVDALGRAVGRAASRRTDLMCPRSAPSVRLRWTYHWFLPIGAKIAG